MPNPIAAIFLSRLRKLRFPTLAVVTGTLFLLTLVVPDPIPFVDELLLGLMTLLFASFKQRRAPSVDPA
jgi:uncharacterized membrane protein YccC